MADQQNRQQRRAAERAGGQRGSSMPDNQGVSAEVALSLFEQTKGPFRSCVADQQIDAWDAPESGEFPSKWMLSAFTSINLGAQGGEFVDACTVTVRASSETEAMIKARAIVRRNWYRVISAEEIGVEGHSH